MSRRLLLGIVLLLALAGFGVERLIVTDREAIESVLEDAAKSVSRGRWDAFEASIDETYAERGQDRKAFAAWVRTTYEHLHPAGVGLEVADTTIDGDHAASRVVVKPGAPYVGYRIGGRVDLVRSADGWRISGVASDDLKVLGR